MSRPIALLGDTITCCPCPQCPFPPFGPYVPAGVICKATALNFLVLGRPAALIGDEGFCGGLTVLTGGAARFLIAGRPAHRIADPNACLGVTTGPGAPTFLIGD